MSEEILFLIGLAVVAIGALILGVAMTRRDRKPEGMTEDQAAVWATERLAVHRRWWQSGVVTLALVIYVSIIGLAAAARQQDEAEANALRNRCQFRQFVEEFFAQQAEGGLSLEEVQAIEGYSTMEPDVRAFVNGLIVALAKESLTVEEARREYIEQFPLDGCDEVK